MTERIVTAKPEHEVAYQDICALVNRHADKVDSLQLLAIAANMLGKLIAFQDQRTVSPGRAMDVVARNLKLGNQQALAEVQNTKGSA